MSRRGSLVAIAVVVAVNAWVLAGVARNRAGEPDASLLLDERELELEPGGRDTGSVRLRLRYLSGPFPERDPRAIFLGEPAQHHLIDRQALESLGFDCSADAGNQRAAAFYGRALPRPAMVAFALGGAEWEGQVTAWQERRRRDVDDRVARGVMKPDEETRSRAEIDGAPARMSRLTVVAVGPDAAALRAQHADRARYLILRAVVGLHHTDASSTGGPSLHGHLIDIMPSALTVPPALAAGLDALREPRTRGASDAQRQGPALLGGAPRYEARVVVGRGYQPWVTGVRLLR